MRYFCGVLTIIRHIEFLLRGNDCVTIPGFGALVAQRCDSVLDEAEMLMPACRRVGFNAMLNHNDGMLAGSIVRHEKVTYAAAVETIENEVAALRAQLQESHEFRFGDLGVFRFSESGYIEFDPCKRVALANLDTYGLPAFKFGKLEAETMVDTIEEEPVRQPRMTVIVRRALKTAAVIATLVLCLFTLTTPIAIDQSVDMANVATISPKQHKSVRVQKTQTVKATIATPAKQDKAASSVKEKPAADYAIIVASFTSARQAEKYVAEMGDTTLTVIDAPKGSRIYKVALCEGSSREELEKIIADRGLADTYPGVWVSHK